VTMTLTSDDLATVNTIFYCYTNRQR